MQKRKFLKSAAAGTLLNLWVPPIVTAVSLPAHAQTSCNDISWQPGLPTPGRCESNTMIVYIQMVLVSPSHQDGASSFTGEVYEVYSDNPSHLVTWRILGGGFIVGIKVSEPVQEGCVGSQDFPFDITNLSPGKIFIVTSCGTIERSLGQ